MKKEKCTALNELRCFPIGCAAQLLICMFNTPRSKTTHKQINRISKFWRILIENKSVYSGVNELINSDN